MKHFLIATVCAILFAPHAVAQFGRFEAARPYAMAIPDSSDDPDEDSHYFQISATDGFRNFFIEVPENWTDSTLITVFDARDEVMYSEWFQLSASALRRHQFRLPFCRTGVGYIQIQSRGHEQVVYFRRS